MKDHFAAEPGYFTAEACDLDELAALCARTLDLAEVPQASRIERNIPIYDGAALRERLSDQGVRRRLMAEWARNFRTGSGIIVIAGGTDDLAAIDAATEAYLRIIAEEKAHHSGADHFGAAGANDRLWNSLQKLCLADPRLFARYFGNPLIDAACEAWLGPAYQMTAQVNLVHPGGRAQTCHRDYHLGFQTPEQCARFPAHVHELSPLMTLQAGIAHCDMSLESGPTKLLPFSQAYPAGYAAYRRPDFAAYFEAHHVQLPLAKGDLLFFNPATFHAAGENRTSGVERFVNLLQIGSAMGRTLEAVDRRAMAEALYPILLENPDGLAPEAIGAVIAASAEGYPFPTNLDTDPPEGGLAPPAMASLMAAALDRRDPPETFAASLAAQAARQRA